MMRALPGARRLGYQLRSSSTQQSKTNDDLDSKLRADVKMLGQTLGEVMRSKDEGLYRAVEKIRSIGKDMRNIAERNSVGVAWIDVRIPCQTLQLYAAIVVQILEHV